MKQTRDVGIAYDRASTCYDLMNRLYFLGRDRTYRSLLAERLRIKPEHFVLNPCCGTGLDFPFLLRYIRNTERIVATDVSSKMLRQANGKNPKRQVDLVRSDSAHLRFRDETFDAIFTSFCLRIVPEYEKAIKEAARVLKHGGKIGVSANHKPSGTLRLVGAVITAILSVMARIDFEIELTRFFSKKFVILEEERLYGGLVQLLVRKKTLQL